MTRTDRIPAATIFDVARLPGVSHRTVSPVLNDLPNVRDSTRARVESAIARLRYVPSQAARALVTRRSRTIGLLATGLPQWGPASVLRTFNEAASAQGYAVITTTLATTDPASLRGAAEMLLRQNVEAVVILAADRAAVDSAHDIEVGVPLVLVASERGGGRGLRIALDQYRGARVAVDHLLAAGHPTVHHIRGPVGAVDAEERVRGWRDALAAHGIRPPHPFDGDWSPESGYRAGLDLLRGADTPLAVFCANDHMALGVYHAAADLGLSIPDDVSVMGFDDVPEAAHFVPPLTTMRQDFVGLGEDALALTLSALSDTAESAAPERRVPSLVERRSVAPIALRAERVPAGV